MDAAAHGRTDDPQANYLTGYGNGRFYLALSNESATARRVTVTLDRERIPYAPNRSYSARLWTDGKPAGTTTVVNGAVTLPLSPKGLTAIAVDDMPVFTRLHADYFGGEQPSVAADKSFRTDKTPVGDATAMFLSFAGRHEFYLWTSASDSDVRAARLTLRNGPAERTLTDQRHPFEFSVPAGDLTTIDYHLQFVRADGTIVDGGGIRLRAEAAACNGRPDSGEFAKHQFEFPFCFQTVLILHDSGLPIAATLRVNSGSGPASYTELRRPAQRERVGSYDTHQMTLQMHTRMHTRSMHPYSAGPVVVCMI